MLVFETALFDMIYARSGALVCTLADRHAVDCCVKSVLWFIPDFLLLHALIEEEASLKQLLRLSKAWTVCSMVFVAEAYGKYRDLFLHHDCFSNHR